MCSSCTPLAGLIPECWKSSWPLTNGISFSCATGQGQHIEGMKLRTQCSSRLTLFLVPILLVVLADAPASGVPLHLAVHSCFGTMTYTTEADYGRITIKNPKEMSVQNGGCSLLEGGVRLAENPILDFWIRVHGTHSAAFFLDFGKRGLDHPGYESPVPHALNIVGRQVGISTLGNIEPWSDGVWHHVVFDLAYAVESNLNIGPETVGDASFWIRDLQRSLDLFSGAPAQPIPATIDLRNIVLRPRQPDETYCNDLSLSVASSPVGDTPNGAPRYLVEGFVVSRQRLTRAEIVIESEHARISSVTLNDVQGRKDFTSVILLPAYRSKIQAKLASNGKTIAESTLDLRPELTVMRKAEIDIIPASHQDVGWFDTPEATAGWRWHEVIGPAVALLERYPDYRYSMEHTLYLMEYLNRVPSQADVVHKLIASGRLAFGAMYNQSYPSLWSGESLIRELYYGRKWLRESLGSDVDSVTAWGTDVPSVAMQMPQILQKSGVKFLMLGRFHPGIFNWFSPDGSKVVMSSLGIYGHLSRRYLSSYQPDQVALDLPALLLNWEDFYGKNNIPTQFPITDIEDFLPPTRQLIPLVHNWNSEFKQTFDISLKLRFATSEEFMQGVTSNLGASFPEVTGEWPNVWAYINGPTHHQTISAGREAIWALTSAEKFWTLKTLASRGSERYPRETFDQAWMAQIYPDHGYGGMNGDLTDAVFRAKEEEALIIGRALLSSSLQSIAEHVTPLDHQNPKLVIFNPLSWKRSGAALVEIPTPPDQEAELVDSSGRPLSLQRVPQVSGRTGGTVRYLIDVPTVPSIGYSTFSVHLKPLNRQTLLQEEFKTRVYENQFYRLEFAPGGLRSIYDKELHMEMLNPEGFLGGEVFMLDSIGNGAGEFGDTQQPSWKSVEKISQYAPSWRLTESGPVRLGWRMEQPMRQVTVRLDVYAYQRSKRIDLDIELLHWSGEKYKEFRMALPINIPHGQVAYEVPYGVLEVGKDEIDGVPFEGWYSRPARQIHPREVQDWVAVSNGSKTVMLSSSVAVWDYLGAGEKQERLTLLQPILLASRKSCHPLGNWYQQKGDHSYHFSLTSFPGDWRHNYRFGNEINCSLAAVISTPEAAEPSLPPSLSLCQISQPNYVVSDIKVADDRRGIIVRGYEIMGQDSEVFLKFPIQIEQAHQTSLIEEDLPEKVDFSDGQLQFKVGHRSINAERVLGRWSP